MPFVRRSTVALLSVELPTELNNEFREFCERFGLGTLTQHVQLALRRYMAAPPKIEVPLLPDIGSAILTNRPRKTKRSEQC